MSKGNNPRRASVRTLSDEALYKLAAYATGGRYHSTIREIARRQALSGETAARVTAGGWAR